MTASGLAPAMQIQSLSEAPLVCQNGGVCLTVDTRRCGGQREAVSIPQRNLGILRLSLCTIIQFEHTGGRSRSQKQYIGLSVDQATFLDKQKYVTPICKSESKRMSVP